MNFAGKLIPAAVSTHSKVQEIFNLCRQGLKSVGRNITEPYAKHFESLIKGQ